jgi:hypothetical protein
MAKAFPAYLLLLLAMAAATACTKQPAEPVEHSIVTGDKLIDDCGPVSDAGFCGVRFGMTLAAARAAFPEPLESFGGDPMNGDELACFVVFPKGRSKELTFMLVDGKVARIDIFRAGIATADGSQVGSAHSDILARHGDRAEVYPGKYDDTKRDIVVDTAPGHQFIFETDGSSVLNYRAGVLPPVGYVEGCS